jgi:hypothetical protein
MPKGNKNWCRAPAAPIPEVKTTFELLLEKLGLREDQEREIECSKVLRDFARKHHKHYYIPERFLNFWGLAANQWELD